MMAVPIRSLVVFGSIGAWVALVSCGADHGTGGTGSSGSGSGAAGGRGGAGSGVDLTDELKPGVGGGGKNGDTPVLNEGVCQQQDFNLSQQPPEVIIVYDRSGSMQRDANNNERGTPTRWAETSAALDQVISATQAQVFWGMQLYPNCMATGNGYECLPTPCTVQGGSLAPALDQHQALKRMIDDATPVIDTGATPTAEAVRVATQALTNRTTENPKFLLLATDGLPNCRNFPAGEKTGGGEEDVLGSVQAVSAAVEAGIPVFVVGIATEGTGAHSALNQMAEAGGRAQNGAVKYYPASSRQQLADTITNIAGQVQDCTFQFASPPPSPNDVAVEIDDTRLAMSDWEYGPDKKSIIVKGMWCEQLRSEKAKKARIKFGCPGIPVL